MKRLSVFALLGLLAVAVGQPPPKGPPRFELGKVFPPPVREALQLTPEQEKRIAALEAEVRAELAKILTEEQRKKAESARPRGPMGKEPSPAPVAVTALENLPPGPQITLGGALKLVTGEKTKATFTLTGDALEGVLGDPRSEPAGRGIRLPSGVDVNKDGEKAGRASWTVNGVMPAGGRWVRFRVHALAQDQFRVGPDDLTLRVEFFKDAGKNPLDHVDKPLAELIDRDRKNLADAGTNKNLGLATWRTFTLDFRTPFVEVDTLRLSVGYARGAGGASNSEFWVSQVEVTPIPDPDGYAAPGNRHVKAPPALSSLVKLGGRWYFDPRGGDKAPPKQFDHANADRLLYLTDRLEAPFAGNMSAWLRQGWQDRDGKTVEKDRFVPDSVVVSFTPTHLVMRSKNLPNHPTATFPDRARLLDGNPNIVAEKADVWRIPLEPKENPKHVALSATNKRALPMGPVGVAANGVVFFNPFDAGTEEAIVRLDRCCGHPGPGRDYHYHKYPACVNTPWDDDGSAHSPLIGFAFDGFPVFGPYEGPGELAKDSKKNPLNEFNLHTDDVRGPHYHVTPGKFPHILGGYWGTVEAGNRPKKGPPKE